MIKKTKIFEEQVKKPSKKINLAFILVNTNQFRELKTGNKISDNIIPKIEKLLENNPSISLAYTEVITDSEDHINKTLVNLMKDTKIDSIIFSGGMGLSEKDITYETVEPRLEKKINGFGEILRTLTYNEIGISAMLFRATAGILRSKKKNKAIFLLPGSLNVIKLAIQHIINPELSHILSLINKEE